MCALCALLPTLVIGTLVYTRIATQEESAARSVLLDNATATINPGQKVGLVGKNGCGKSTLLHMLGCVDTPSSGTLLFSGQDVTRLSDRDRSLLRLRQIGFVFQRFFLLPMLTAEEMDDSALQTRQLVEQVSNVIRDELLVACALGEVVKRACQADQVLLFSALNNRHDEASVAKGDSAAKVHVLLEDDLLAVDGGVHKREGLKRTSGCLKEERSEAQAKAFALLERIETRSKEVSAAEASSILVL